MSPFHETTPPFEANSRNSKRPLPSLARGTANVAFGLTARAFLWLCVWQFIGSLAIFSKLFLYAYGSLVVPLGLIFYRDRRRLARTCPFAFELRGSAAIELDRISQMSLSWTRQEREISPISSWEIELPEWDLVSVSPRTIAKAHLKENNSKLTLEIKGRKLGVEPLGRARWKARSPSGLWTSTGSLELVGDDIRISPSTEAMPEEKFAETIHHHRRLFLGSRQIMRSHALEQFHSVRAYAYPDPLRAIDHKKTARYGRMMTRTYDAYHQHHLVILCDLGRSLTGTIGSSAKLAFYLSAAANLVRHALHARDQVSFCAFRERPYLTIARARSAAAFGPLWQGHPDLVAQEIDSDYDSITAILRQVAPQRAMVVLLTDISRPSVQRSLLASLGPACRQHRLVALGLIDQKFELQARLTARFAAGKNPDMLEKHEAAEWIYSYALDAEYAAFRERMNALPCGVFAASERHWLDMVKRIYELMRISLGTH